MKMLKRNLEEHLIKEQEFLINQLELINKESNNAMSASELEHATNAMCKVLKLLSIPYALRLGIFFVVIFQLLISVIILVKKFFWSKR